MTYIRTFPLQNSAILRINSEKEEIEIDPPYQRKGDIWTKEKKQLLIDSILNDFDIPKLYFHYFTPEQKKADKYLYAIIDGRQRLETIWDFIEGKFPLAGDFVYLHDNSVDAGGLTYADIGKEYPRLKIRFDSFNLPIICIETDDLDLIEDMFSRLNEAVPLNAAEKRNAIGGPMAQAIRDVSEHNFFRQKVKFPNTRYQHREVAAKFLYIEYTLHNFKKVRDTKKPFLDDMVKKFKVADTLKIDIIVNKAEKVLDLMSNLFSNDDEVLRTQSGAVIYYLVFKKAYELKELAKISRAKFILFYSELEKNRKIAETDIANANFEYLEFDRMSQQGTNDAISINERVRIMCKFLRVGNFIDYLRKLETDQITGSIESVLIESFYEFPNLPEVSSAIAETNAVDFGVDEFEIINYEILEDEVIIDFSFHMTGEQLENKAFHGSEIAGEGNAIIDGEKRTAIEVVNAQVITD
jgi:hypothetical protein